MTARLGDLLISRGDLTPQQLDMALGQQRENGGRLGRILAQSGYATDEALACALARQYGLPSVALDSYDIDEGCLSLIPVKNLMRHLVLPLMQIGSSIVVAVADPTNVQMLDEIKFMTGCDVEVVVAPENSLISAIERYFGSQEAIELQTVCSELTDNEPGYSLDPREAGDFEPAELQDDKSQAPLIRFVNLILADSIRQSASDIHFESYEREFRIRFRIDGLLYTRMKPPAGLRDAIISRLKIMSNLDISERRLPQDGRIKVNVPDQHGKREVDFRVSTIPTLFGEKVVLRILDRKKLPSDLNRLGLDPSGLMKFQRAISQSHGMVLVTGPTGSGKTSTLYTGLRQLNTDEVNIITAEDPVEFSFLGMNQVQISDPIGRTFAGVLRASLRQDPDIIMVGEIRDLVTAEIAVKAALTGHLVLSTLHTGDAPAAVIRLLNMGMEPFLVANSIHLICAQRLVRVICPACKREATASPQALIALGVPPSQVEDSPTYRGAGCRSCNRRGYRGRTGLFEVMEMSQSIQRLVLARATSVEIRTQARAEGMLTLRESGLQKMLAGITTLEEVLRETSTVQADEIDR